MRESDKGLPEYKKVCCGEMINGALVMSALIRSRPAFNECVVQADVEGDELISGAWSHTGQRSAALHLSTGINRKRWHQGEQETGT